MSALGNFRGERLNPDDVGVFRLSNGREDSNADRGCN